MRLLRQFLDRTRRLYQEIEQFQAMGIGQGARQGGE
jgi:hypothetical protein